MKQFTRCLGPVFLIAVLLLSGGCTKKMRAKWNMRAGDHDFAEEKYDAAEIDYKKVLRYERFNGKAVGQLGRIYVKEGRTLDARIYLKKAIELVPDSLPYQLAYGQVIVALRDTSNAANIAWKVLSVQPTNQEALLLLIDAHGPPADVEQRLDTVPHIKENPAYHTAIAMLAMRQGQPARTENEIGEALKLNPKSPEAYFVMADMRARQKDEKGAVEALKKASDLSPWRSTLRIKYIDFLIRNNNGEEARKELVAITQHAPDFVPAWIGLMNLCMSEKKYDEAAKYADTVVERDELNFDGLLGRGTARMAKGDADGAVIQFEHMNSVFPKNPQVLYQLASAYLMAHNRAKCIEDLNAALTIAPNYPQAIIMLAQLDIQAGQAGNAIKMLSDFIKRTPSAVAEVYLLLADADVILNKYDDALGIYSYLSKVLPTNPKMPMLSGVVLMQEHRTDAARAAFEHALELQPDFILAAEQLVELDAAEHNFADAQKVAEAQVARSPKAVEPLELLAKVDIVQSNYSGAESILNKAIALNPKAPNPYILLAHVYANTGKIPEALQKLKVAAEETNDVNLYLQMGELNDRAKNYEAARDAYEQALSVNSNSIAALNNLSYIYSERLHDLDKALALAERARVMLPNNPNIADTSGWILFRKGEYARALPIMQDCADKAPNDPEIQYHAGMTYYMLGQESAARGALQKAMAAPQPFPGKDDARRRLAILDMSATSTDANALAQLEKALKEHPDDPVVLNRIGYQQERAGQWDKAAATYEAVLKAHPDSGAEMAKIAWIDTFHLHDPARASDLAKSAHKLDGSDPVASEVLGHWLFRSHEFERSISLLEEALDKLPRQPEVLQDLAWAYYSVGRVADGVNMMQRAVQAGAVTNDLGDPKHFLALANAYSTTAGAAAAAGEAQQALQSNPAFVPALMVTGVNQEHAGNFKAAQEAYAKALDVFPKFSPAQRLLTLVDARHFPDDPKGLAFGEDARAAYPDDADVNRSLAIISFSQGKYSRSAELLRPGSEDGTGDGEAMYYLGMDYFHLKRSRECKRALERAMAMKIPDNLATDAKKTLASLK